MFIINKNTIRSEFHKSSWAHDFDRYETLCRTGIAIDKDGKEHPMTAQDVQFVHEFTEEMDSMLNFILENTDLVNAYLAFKRMFTAHAMSPADFEYGFFGNIVAGCLPVEYESPTDDTNMIDDIERMASTGYIPNIEKIVSNEPFTIVQFADGDTVKVKCDCNDKFNAKTGVYLALLKKAIGSKNLHHLFKLLSNAMETESAPDIPQTPAADDSVFADADEIKTLKHAILKHANADSSCNENKITKEFVDMCFDPKYPMCNQLKQSLLTQLGVTSSTDETEMPEDMETVNIDGWDDN